MEVAAPFGLKTFLQIAPTAVSRPAAPPGIAPRSFSNPALRERFVDDVKRVAGLRPDYLNLGAEINLLYYSMPDEFEHFVSRHANR
ncbi:MAG: hypothetical protein ACREUU_01475 [Gammaproteobacteria bacterium]